MKRSYLEKVNLKKKLQVHLRNKKIKKTTVADFTKKRGENISTILIQEGSVMIKFFRKIYNFYLQQKRLAIR